MPVTTSGAKVMRSMQSQYGEEKGERVFYASINKGKPGSAKWHRKRSAGKRVPPAKRALMRGGR